jgi:transcriptional regulator with XRE-family HTH domain
MPERKRVSDKPLQEQAADLSSRWICHAMDKAGLTQGELAKRSGINSGNLSQYANGRRIPTLRLLVEILEACGLEIVELRVKLLK